MAIIWAAFILDESNEILVPYANTWDSDMDKKNLGLWG